MGKANDLRHSELRQKSDFHQYLRIRCGGEYILYFHGLSDLSVSHQAVSTDF